ncbi:MAG: SH3 domain-containing protein, partial [Chloroflexota bacterium]|nr:SH3 domain-containing protein [Chloroflexota bacterium]
VWGDRVDVLSGPHPGNWYEVRYNGIDGYAFGDFLSLDSGGGGGGASTANWAASGTGTSWIDTDFLNLRSDAASWASVLTVGSQGEAVTTLGGEVDGYLPVEYRGLRGWMWSGYLAGSATSVSAGPERWIDVDRSSGIVTLYIGNEAQFSSWGAMGFDLSDDGYYATANGTFYIYSKNAGLTWTNWGRVYIDNWVAFDPYRQNGFHSYSLDANGNEVVGASNPTGGCIALPEWAAEVIYDFARQGTRVEVHW